MTLVQFLKEHREELIKRTRAKVASRSPTSGRAVELEHGVPLFLSQLSKTLEDESSNGTKPSVHIPSSFNSSIGASAALHGLELLKFGFTIDQVVHAYGDVCQAVTELAEERDATLTIEEFHTLNRCLDDAIAGAVSSWSDERERSRSDKPDGSSAFVRDLGRLLDQATTTFEVLRHGTVAVGGATGTLLQRALVDMRTLLDGATGK